MSLVSNDARDLTKATEEFLRPASLKPTEFLELWLCPDLRDFFCRLVYLSPVQTLGSIPVDLPDGTRLFEEKRSMRHFSEDASFFLHRFMEREVVDADELGRPIVKFPPTDMNIQLVHHSWGESRIIFRNENTKMLFKKTVLQHSFHLHRAKAQALFKATSEVLEMPPDFDEHHNPNLRLSPYQKAALLFSLGQEGSMFDMEPGTGKTCVVIARISLEAKRYHLAGNKNLMRVLVICPNQVRTNWEREFTRFATTPGRITIIKGNKAKRVKLMTHALKPDKNLCFTALVVGYDTVSSMQDVFLKIPWDLCVLDESQYIKKPTTKRSVMTRKLREICTHRQILTGTPIGNTLMDLWAQLEFLGRGASGFRSFKNFKSFHGQYERSFFGFDKLVGYQNVPFLQERMTRLAFSITREEANLQLPDKLYMVKEVEMTPQQEEYYAQLSNELAIEIQSDLQSGDPRRVSADHILTKLLRLAQVCSGYIKVDPIVDTFTGEIISPSEIKQIGPENPKMDALVLDIQERIALDSRSKTVVWCCFQEDIQQIVARLKKAGIECGHYYGKTGGSEREANVDKFNGKDSFKVLVCNPATAGEGLNLLGFDPRNPEASECYCDYEDFFSVNWSYLLREQAEARAHRRGTRRPVQITDWIIPGTIDDHIRSVVAKKRDLALGFRDVKDILSTILGISTPLIDTGVKSHGGV